MDAIQVSIPVTDAPRPHPLLLRSLLLASCAASVLGSASVGSPAAYLEGDLELARLLRAMTLIKAVMIGAALTGLLWRFRWPVSFPLGAAYIAGATMTAGASGLIWSLAHVGAGAVLFHIGAAVLLVSALLDRSGSYRDPARVS